MTATTIGYTVGFGGGAVVLASLAITAGDEAVKFACAAGTVIAAAFAAYHIALCLGYAA